MRVQMLLKPSYRSLCFSLTVYESHEARKAFE